MSLNKWLLPNEDIKYSSHDDIEFAGEKLRIHVTNERIILYSNKGFIFKKETVVAERLSDVETMAYHESGILMLKKGVLQVQTRDRVMDFKGKPDAIKTLWQVLQKYIRR